MGNSSFVHGTVGNTTVATPAVSPDEAEHVPGYALKTESGWVWIDLNSATHRRRLPTHRTRSAGRWRSAKGHARARHLHHANDQLDRVYEAFVHSADAVLEATPIRWGAASSLLQDGRTNELRPEPGHDRQSCVAAR